MHTKDHDTGLLVKTPGAKEPNNEEMLQSYTRKEIQIMTGTTLRP